MAERKKGRKRYLGPDSNEEIPARSLRRWNQEEEPGQEEPGSEQGTARDTSTSLAQCMEPVIQPQCHTPTPDSPDGNGLQSLNCHAVFEPHHFAEAVNPQQLIIGQASIGNGANNLSCHDAPQFSVSEERGFQAAAAGEALPTSLETAATSPSQCIDPQSDSSTEPFEDARAFDGSSSSSWSVASSSLGCSPNISAASSPRSSHHSSEEEGLHDDGDDELVNNPIDNEEQAPDEAEANEPPEEQRPPVNHHNHDNDENFKFLKEQLRGGYLDVINTPIDATKSDALYMVLGMAKQNKHSNKAFNDAVLLVNALFNEPVLPTSRFLLDKVVMNWAGIKFYFYCEKCTANFGELNFKIIKEKECETCGTINMISDLRTSHFFCIFNFPSQLESVLGNVTVRQSLKSPGELFQMAQAGSTLSDIHCGSEYRKFASAHVNARDHVISLHFNTDGSPLFSSSKCSIWPISLAINELPPHMRMKNLILCGLWFGTKKPPMDLFLTPFVSHMSSLARGFQVQFQGEVWDMRAYVIGCCVDSGARGQVQGLKTHSGYSSCNWCLIHGKYVAKAVRFPLTQEVPADRTHEEMIRLQARIVNIDANQNPNVEQDLESNDSNIDEPVENDSMPNSDQEDLGAEEQEEENDDGEEEQDQEEEEAEGDEEDDNEELDELHGVNAVSPLIGLPGFDMVKGFFVEPMHLLDLGITRTFLQKWMGSAGSPYYVGDALHIINKRISSLRPPVEFRRMPRVMDEFPRMKARELDNLLMFLIYVLLLGILDEKYLKIWLLFAQAVYLLSLTVISPNHLQVADTLMKYFMYQSQETYGESIMKFNLHILYHLSQHTARWGPVWATSAYCFESLNGWLKNIIRNQQGIPHQVIRALSWEQCLKILEPVVSQKAKDYVINIADRKNKYSKETLCGSSVLLGRSKSFTPADGQEEYLAEQHNIDINYCETFKKLIKDRCVFSSFNQTSSTDNSMALLHDNRIVLIHKILYDQPNDKIFLIVSDVSWQPVIVLPANVHIDLSDHLMRKITVIDEEKKVISPDALKIVCFRGSIVGRGDFVAPLPNILNVF